MYIFDVNYSVNGDNYSKSYLLAESKDGFELQDQLQFILEKEYQTNVQIVETDFEEL